MGMLQVVIGLIFVLLLLSLLATTIMELIASLFGLRGQNLEKALKNMLASSDVEQKILQAFQSNALYKQLSFQYGKNRQAPSYLSSDSFQSILLDVIAKGEGLDNLKAQIQDLPDDDLKKVLNQFLDEADNKLDVFKKKVETWYNDVMDRASGWYKRYTQKILIGVGFLIAVVFNADTLAIYERLESDPESLQAVVDLAEDYVNGADNESVALSTSPELAQSIDKLEGLINNQIETVKSPLGLGWKNIDWAEVGPYDVLTTLLGWIVTALAISLGAPFWFDLLRKIVNIRSSGAKPN
ncbi:MAG TPA: hypothetical protein PKA00_07235 [Saprospiraceae bacterium]|nr:hypothetical protein [Saprospiraceae bacterium]HMQ82683.1 hypothetical protein [Saprospiraceae bacterium]